MLKPTQKTLTKEQFYKLREAKRIIKKQFGTEFSLQSERLVRDVYEFALRSETNELFQIFSELNAISSEPMEQPLNEEQFVQLRLAKDLIRSEFAQDLLLVETDVMDSLYGFALNSSEEDLFDIYMYLYSRPDRPPQTTAPAAKGMRFRKLRQAKHLAEAERGQAVNLNAHTGIDMLSKTAADAGSAQLLEIMDWLNSHAEDTPGATGFIFEQLSAPDFERLREAKLRIYEEFGEAFSLHSDTSLDDLYSFALRSRDIELFDLFCDLLGPQMTSRADISESREWLSKEQFMLLRAAREAIQAEFGVMLPLQSATLQDDLYQFALRAEEEELFDVCSAFQQLCEPVAEEPVLPSKAEFRMLRRARQLVDKEFSEELALQSDVLESDLYKYAVNSEADELFDLFTDLMALRADALAESSRDLSHLLSKDEFVELRGAKRLILTEFGEHLALEEPYVLDRLYAFALESEGEALFDLHAKLNAKAEQSSPAPTPDASIAEVVAEAEESHGDPDETPSEPKPAATTRFEKLLSWWGKPSTKAPAEKSAQTPAEADEPPADENLPAPSAAESEVLRPSFPDLLVKAMAEKGTSVRVHEVELTESEVPQRKAGAANEPASVKSDRERRPPAAAGAAYDTAVAATDYTGASGWYVSTIDDRLKVSLGPQLSVGTGGELMVAAPQDAQSMAVIEMIADQPVVFAQDQDLTVNDHPVRDKQTLASGDKIAVAGTLLQIDYADRN